MSVKATRSTSAGQIPGPSGSLARNSRKRGPSGFTGVDGEIQSQNGLGLGSGSNSKIRRRPVKKAGVKLDGSGTIKLESGTGPLTSAYVSSNSTQLASLQTLSLEFDTSTRLAEFLNALHLHNVRPRLKKLSIKFKEPNESLTNAQLLNLLTRLDTTSLEHVELHCGLWEDVQAGTVVNFLQNSSQTLQYFKLMGNFQGEDEWKRVLSFEVPELPRLEYFSFGCNYDFLSVYESPEPENYNSRAPTFVSLTETQLLRTKVSFPSPLPNLKALVLGNLVGVEDMRQFTKVKFPVLTCFQVGSSWNDSIQLEETESYSVPVFSTITELQLPDCLLDEKFVQKLYRMFPNVCKIWLNLPSVRCLRRFFFTMQRSRLRELHLQTQYDFPFVLESAFISKAFNVVEELRKSKTGPGPGTSKSGSGSGSGSLLEEIEKLKNPNNCNQIYKDYIHHHNLSLPLTKDEMDRHNAGISSLSRLQVLEFHHVPRLLRIPTSNSVLFTSPDATFDLKHRIGFLKYPLAEKLFTEEFPKLRNLKRLKFLGENFTVNKDVWIKFCRRCHFNNFADYDDVRDNVNDGAAAVKDKLEPSKICRAKEFLPKSEPSPSANSSTSQMSSITGVPLINPYNASAAPVKIEVKQERE